MSLGKGLGSLIPAPVSMGEGEVDINKIKVNPHQPRVNFHHQELEDLINSVKEHGILQPLIVTKAEDGYELIAGERRLKAAKIAGLMKVPVIIREASELEKLELALIENIQRSDLNPMEKAEGYRKLVHEFGITQEEAAKKVGVSRSAFTNTLRLLKLPAAIQKALSENQISEGHAKVLLGLANESLQMVLYRKITNNNLSVRGLEQSLALEPTNQKKKKKISYQDPQLLSWQDELGQKLGTKVNIKKKGEGGAINIEYYSVAELAGIIAKIKE